MAVLVLGGYGTVGTHLVRLLRAEGIPVQVAGRDPARAERVVDIGDSASVDAALTGITLVVNCVGAEDIRLARSCAERGITFVDISATSDYVRSLEDIDGPAVLGVGLAPGLTTLLAVDAFEHHRGPVDIMIGLGSGEAHGPAATAWTYRLLGQRFPDADGTRIRNFTGRQRFPLPEDAGYRPFPAVRADFADQHRLTRELGVPVRTYLRLDSRLATLGLAALTWAPALQSLAPAHMPGSSDRWVAVARSADGYTTSAIGRGQSSATAVVAAITVRTLLRTPITAPTWIHQLLALDSIRHDPLAADIRFSRS
ncbi:saccharopine dehydrogenase NADP-binding domain-containing protein [Nocardia sp. A7]|uniref:saccharopine dehydrogenase NADP-binding domain-containing protein n=1 Tax=Nocardia sp. A7 TaxID=2789274 RepID=UPI00397D8914